MNKQNNSVAGPSAVGAEVEQGLADIGVTVASRYSGDNRFATAREIFRNNSGWGSLAIIASGTNFADACSVAPIAFSEKAPLFLVDANGSLDAESEASIESSGFTTLLIIGGTAAVSQDVDDWAITLGYSQAEGASNAIVRIYGDDRYKTSAALANWAIENLGYKREGMAVATGGNFPDALCGGYMQGRSKSVLLLSDSGQEGACAVVASVTATKPQSLIYLGGEVALPRKARAAITDALLSNSLYDTNSV